MGVRVKILQGDLEGSVKKSGNGLDYVRFLGVPYAKVERFAKPAPPASWEGVKKANSSIKCLQYDSLIKKGIVGKEDGLVANVYTPKSALEEDAGPLPVMVFIHGGAFYLGDGTPEFYGPGWLIDHGIVLVTINYRLGPLGFMSTGNDVIPANLVCLLTCSFIQLQKNWFSISFSGFVGPAASPCLGSREYQQVWRRPRERDHLWRERWLHELRLPHPLPPVHWTLPQGYPRVWQSFQPLVSSR